MKSIEIGFSKEKIINQETIFSDYELLKTAINSPIENHQGIPVGFSINEMMVRLRLLSTLEKHAKEMDINASEYNDSILEKKFKVDFEDADYEKLKQLVASCKWGIVAKAIVNLSERFN